MLNRGVWKLSVYSRKWERKEMTCDKCHETNWKPVMTQTSSPAARGEVNPAAEENHKPPHTQITTGLLVLTDFELPLYSLHIAVPVLGLDGVTVTHQLHKLLGQDAVLEGREHFVHNTAVSIYGSWRFKIWTWIQKPKHKLSFSNWVGNMDKFSRLGKCFFCHNINISWYCKFSLFSISK